MRGEDSWYHHGKLAKRCSIYSKKKTRVRPVFQKCTEEMTGRGSSLFDC